MVSASTSERTSAGGRHTGGDRGLAMVHQALAAGLKPPEVAGRVFSAIAERRFYVLTHPEHNRVITKRTEAMLAGTPPPAIGSA